MAKILTDKVAVIYGGGPISGGVARAFAREGACIYLAGRNRSKISRIADEVSANGLAVKTCRLDALNEREVTDFVDHVAASEGRLDISFNLIGLGDVQQTLGRISVEDFLQPIIVAMRSHFLTTRAASRHMKARRSGVVLTFGGGGPQTLPGLGGFKIALDALEGMRRQFACELGEFGIRVITIKTGGIPESIPEDFAGRETIEDSIRHGSLLKRVATLEDVGNVASFLASDLAATITGTDINISCGSILE